jgi:hypothetical protein
MQPHQKNAYATRHQRYKRKPQEQSDCVLETKYGSSCERTQSPSPTTPQGGQWTMEEDEKLRAAVAAIGPQELETDITGVFG